MADILVQNASEKLAQAITDSSTKTPWSTILGQSLNSYLKAHIEANPTGGPYYSGSGGGAGKLCDLSRPDRISFCQCAYAGSGTSCTCQHGTNNLWTDGSILASGSISVTKSTMQARLTSQSKQLERAYVADNAGFVDDFYYAYLGLKDDFVADSNATILENWYGVGGSSSAPGKRLSETNYIKVCGASSTWKCGVGATCTWTVPAGATTAKFQAWGAGKGSNPGCCCGGHPFSNNGVYSEITIKVTAGDQYSVCAGCSCQRWCCSSTEPGYGCMSGVTGNGICCFKADGAYAADAPCASLNTARVSVGNGGNCRRFQQLWCNDSGPCWCSYGYYCYASSCATCGMVPVATDCCQSCGCSCATTACKVNDGGDFVVRSIVGGGCLETNNYGFHLRPPIIDADSGSEFSCSSGCYYASFSSNCCCGGCNGSNWNWHPGHGGSYTHVMGGNNTHKGDTGRGGMVQISWT